MIRTEFKSLYQVRFETLLYGDPIFNKIADDPLEIQFQGGTIGIHQTYFNNEISRSISCKCNIQGAHYFYTLNEWQYINTTFNYNLHNYEYIWFASNDSNTFTLTEIDYV